jgi:NurA-like 5'-3' nuclease
MKKSISTILLGLGILISNLYGQMSPPNFNAEKAAGIFQYDIEKVIKKMKIIDDSLIAKVTESLNDYNSKMDSLSLIHATTFQELEADFDKNVQIAMRNRDRSQMDGVKAKIQRIIPPIRKQVQEYEELLNSKMANYLTESQNKKWLKYQNGKKSN